MEELEFRFKIEQLISQLCDYVEEFKDNKEVGSSLFKHDCRDLINYIEKELKENTKNELMVDTYIEEIKSSIEDISNRLKYGVVTIQDLTQLNKKLKSYTFKFFDTKYKLY